MNNSKKYYCYFLSNKNRTVLYIGYTDNLERRISEHQKRNGALFTKKHNAIELIYFEIFTDIKGAKLREKKLKDWHKEWKWNLVKVANPNLKTLDSY